MKTIFTFLILSLIISELNSQVLLKPVEKKHYNQKATIYLLDSTISWLMDYNTMNLEFYDKEIYVDRVSGAEYLWKEKHRYEYDVANQSWLPKLKTKQSYFSNSPQSPAKIIEEYPWNSSLNAWDDTLYFINMTGDTNYTYDFPIYTYQLEKGYDYQSNYFNYGLRTFITVINDTLPILLEQELLDTVTQQFNKSMKIIITYNSNFLFDTVYYMSYDINQNQYVNNFIEVFIYDSNNNNIEIISKVWNGSNWENSNREINNYNSSNLVVERIYQFWDNLQQLWLNINKEEMAYNSSNLITLYISYNWDSNLNDWQPIYKYEMDYDANGNVIKDEQFSYDGISFVSNGKSLYSYDQNNNVLEYIYQTWDNLTNQYVNSYKSEYYYTANLHDSTLFYYWYSVDNDWILNFKIINSYNNQDDILLNEHLMFDGTNWNTFYKTQYFYSLFNLNINSNNKPEAITIYPNPTSNFINISGNVDEKISNIRIFNEDGRLVKNINYPIISKSIYVGDLKAGTYFISVSTPNKKYTSKFIKN